MSVGRFFCVGFPLVLTIAAIVAMLISTLSGVAHNKLYLFQLDTEDLSIDKADLDNFAENVFGVNTDDIDIPGIDDVKDTLDDAKDSLSDIADDVKDEIDKHTRLVRQTKTENITAQDLQMGKLYDVNLWGYCWVDFEDNERHCTKAKYDWASDSLNSTYIENFGSTAGVKIELPDELKDALKAFQSVSKWTQIVTIVACVGLGIELVLGILSNFSRVFSCFTYLVAVICIFLVGAAAGLATAQSLVVVGAVEATAKFYGVRGKVGGQYLAAIWISFAFTLVASSFWLFTICCCKPEHRSRKDKHRSADGEKLMPYSSGPSYAPVGHGHEMTSGPYSNGPRNNSGGRSDLAYEPYSHRA